MDARNRPRIWDLIEPPDNDAGGEPDTGLEAVLAEAAARSGCRLHSLMGDDQAVRVLARPKAPEAAVVSASVDLFGVTAGPGDDSEGRLRTVRVVVTLADGFGFSAYLMPDEARRVAGYIRVGARDGE